MTKKRSYKIRVSGEADVDILATDERNALVVRGMDRPWKDGDVAEVSLSKGKSVTRFRRDGSEWIEL